MRILLAIILFFCQLSLLQAQDPHFSQYELISFEMNPALMGQFDGQWRVSATYRNQWFSVDNAAGFNTSQVGAELKINGINEDHWSVGISILNDQVGFSKYKNFNAKIAGAYTMTLEAASYNSHGKHLSLATQIGLGQNSIGFGDLWFGRQYDFSILDVNSSIDNGEPGIGVDRLSSNVYSDINLGIHYSMGFSKSTLFNIGLGAFHLNQPSLSFAADRGNQLTRKFLIHTDVDLSLNNQVSINPYYIFVLQSPFFQHQLGSRLIMTNLDEQKFGLGVGTRMTNSINGMAIDAILLNLEFQMSNYKVGLGYDITISKFSQANNNQGAFEMHLIYIL